jgi:hypothetical protein
MLEDVAGLDSVEFALAVLDKSGSARRGLLERARDQRRSIGYRLFDSLDRRLFARAGHAFEPVDLAPLFAGVPVLGLTPRPCGSADAIDDDDVARLRAHRVDVILQLGARTLSGPILGAARHGVWCLRHADDRLNRGGPPGFWEVMLRWPVTGAVLQALGDESEGARVLARCWSMTDPLSPARNRDVCYRTAALMLPRSLKRLAQQTPQAVECEFECRAERPDFASGRPFTTPGNAQAAYWLARYLARLARHQLRRAAWVGQWYLAYGIGETPPLEPYRFRKLLPPPDRFWADPHVLCRDGRYYVFFEELPFRIGRAHISVVEIDAEGRSGPVRRAIEEPYHLSYPFVFEHDGATWMIPESMHNRTVDLYRCVEFPHRWQHEKTLMRGLYACDATLWFKDGKWWMFATVARTRQASSSDELFIFFADRFDSTHWQPHPMNPVISDCRRARPAGALFERAGKLYRPSQNSSWRYGRSININEVLELTETTYRERRVSEITPDWHPSVKGVHGLSMEGGITVIDTFHYRRRF